MEGELLILEIDHARIACSTVCPSCLKNILSRKEGEELIKITLRYRNIFKILKEIDNFFMKTEKYWISTSPSCEVRVGNYRIFTRLPWIVIFPLCESCGKPVMKRIGMREIHRNMIWLLSNLKRKVYTVGDNDVLIQERKKHRRSKGELILFDSRDIGIACFTVCILCERIMFTPDEAEEFAEAFVTFLRGDPSAIANFQMKYGQFSFEEIKMFIEKPWLKVVLGVKDVVMRCPRSLMKLDPVAFGFIVLTPLCRSCRASLQENHTRIDKIDENIIRLLKTLPVKLRRVDERSSRFEIP